MQRRNLLLPLAAALSLGVQAHAQTAPPAPSWLTTPLTVAVKNETVIHAMRRLLKAVGKDADVIDLEEPRMDVRFSLDIEPISIGDALAVIGKLCGAAVSLTERDGKVYLFLRKSLPDPLLRDLPLLGNLFDVKSGAISLPLDERAVRLSNP